MCAADPAAIFGETGIFNGLSVPRIGAECTVLGDHTGALSAHHTWAGPRALIGLHRPVGQLRPVSEGRECVGHAQWETSNRGVRSRSEKSVLASLRNFTLSLSRREWY